MPQVLVDFDESTLKAIDQVAPAAKHDRAEFIIKAVKDALFHLETDRMREAYRLQPDSAEGADVWELPEKFEVHSSRNHNERPPNRPRSS